MIAPRTLAEMTQASRLEATKAAIVAELKRLMVGVTVVAHPGKLDIADVVAKEVVQAPGVAIGWTRIRAPRDIGGAFGTTVEWAAYVVAEDRADPATKKRLNRETVAHAIGSFLLEILNCPDASSWGLTGVTPALQDPAPEFKPVFTAKSFEQGTSYHAVTWVQLIVDQGEPFFDGATPAAEPDGPDGADFPAGVPDEIRAIFAGSEP